MATKKAYVIGFPITHSLSPAIFSFLATKLKANDFEYAAHPIEPKKFSSEIKVLFSNSDLVGLNVTIPFKETILPFLSSLNEAAKAIGAVNVVHKLNGKTLGHNTDVIGILETCEQSGIRIEGGKFVILGAGGAARAAAYLFGKQNAKEVLILNRTAERAAKLVYDIQGLFPKTKFGFQALNDTLDQSVFEDLRMAVQATPSGMSSTEANSDLVVKFAARLSASTSVFEMVYRPRETLFVKTAKGRGCQVLEGLDMLVYQALATWEIWFGPLKDKKTLASELKNFLDKKI